MDLRRLRYFITVAEELHFGRAAARLHMSQPPLSQSIQALEAELGVRLFTRTKRSVVLSDVGRQWLPWAQKLLADAAALPDIAARLAKGEIGTLRVAFVSTASYSKLPVLISRFKTRFPEVDVALREATSDVQIDALLAGEIDAGMIIAAPQPVMPAHLHYVPLLQERLLAAIPSAWITSGRIVPQADGLDFADIGGEPLILFPRHSAPALHDIITGYYQQHGLVPRLGQQAVQMQTIVALVSEAMGVALVPDSLRNLARAGVTYLPLRQTAPVIETGLAWNATNTAATLLRFIELVRAEAG
jgi:DNA-binding transcriptional LysR family regulator